MTKAALILLGVAALAILPGTVPAQDNSAIAAADSEAVLRQANTIVLRQKLTEAKVTEQRGDMAGAARLYQESCDLAEQIGSGIPEETMQAVAGLTATRLALARDAQSRGDYHEADTQVMQIVRVEGELKVSPDANDVMAFRKHNDELLFVNRGRLPDADTMAKVPQMVSERVSASTLVQDGKVFYEMGKYDESEIKLNEALRIDPNNTTASYYLDLIQQDKIKRDAIHHNTDTQLRMEHVEKQWILPENSAKRTHLSTDTAIIPTPNAYATNTLVWTGPGRQAIVAKLDHIRLDNVSFDGLPLSEVLKQLAEQCKLRDPDRKGINFLINNNPDLSGDETGAPLTANVGVGGAGGGGGGIDINAGRGAPGGAVVNPTPQLDPNTGLPIAPAAGENATAATEQQDIGSYIVKIPSLTDVRLADLLDAIVLVSEHPIKYSIEDYAVVFSSKNPYGLKFYTRTYRVDPNTFYSGLENVGAQSFGAIQSGSSGSSGGGGGGGGGQQNNGAVVGVVNAFAGAGGFRSSGQGGGGGGGGGQGSGSLLSAGGAAGAAGGGGGGQNAGGLAYITSQTQTRLPSQLVIQFFNSLGLNLSIPGKAVFFNDRLGYLFVRSTESDLDTIEKALQVLDTVPPQVHIKARFIEVQQSDDNELGLDWSLGQFNLGNQVVGQGGSAPSLTTPSGNPFPGEVTGNGAFNVIPPSATDQSLTQGLRNSAPTLATFTGIMTDPNFRVALRALSQRTGVETLGEPEITVLSGRQTQMRATSVVTVIIGLNFQAGQSAVSSGGIGGATP